MIVRAFNVLRQYAEAEVARGLGADDRRHSRPVGVVEGTCDELGRLASWVLLDAAGPGVAHPGRTAVHPGPAESTLAERLPKALIHHNVPGQPIHALLSALDDAWLAAAPLRVFGPRQRWCRAVVTLVSAGWPVPDRPARWRYGELTVAWPAVAPLAA